MKILWVKAGGLVPPDSGGKIRSYNILRELAKENSVTLFSFHAADANNAHQELSGIFRRVISVPLDLPRTRSFGELCDYGTHVLTRQPYNIAKYCKPQVCHKLRELLRQQSFDVVICDFLIAAGAIPWEISTPKVLFTHNVESQIWQRHYEVARSPLWKGLSWWEWRLMEAAERKYATLADHVLAVSEDDCRFFREFIAAKKLSVIPTGVDIQYFSPTATAEIPNSLVFTGSMDWLPNEDGVVYFIKEILPLVRKELPDVSLTVVGRNPSRQAMAVARSSPKVQMTGRVEDIRPFVRSAAVCVVPLRIGSGTRLKIFEAMSMGKAVISTTIGAEGLPVKHGEHLLIADDPQTFTKCVCELLSNPEKRIRMGEAARKLVGERFSWAQVTNELKQVLTRVTGRHEP
jgi:polysaccharide biosynthesis protein PslH